ncbi:MAG: hypothetical protein LBP22_08760 [Deltaproteobacteria bacterium]|jgi:hypothetical protein|nr:hypothetical protein [Deltaproteobacteria bacterium]
MKTASIEGIRMEMNFRELARAVMSGRLPEGFDRWALADKDGETVAHIAAKFGHLPEGFDRWE